MKTIREHISQIPYFGMYALEEANRQNPSVLDSTANKCSEALVNSFNFKESAKVNPAIWWRIYFLLIEMEDLEASELNRLNNKQ